MAADDADWAGGGGSCSGPVPSSPVLAAVAIRWVWLVVRTLELEAEQVAGQAEEVVQDQTRTSRLETR